MPPVGGRWIDRDYTPAQRRPDYPRNWPAAIRLPSARIYPLARPARRRSARPSLPLEYPLAQKELVDRLARAIGLECWRPPTRQAILQVAEPPPAQDEGHQPLIQLSRCAPVRRIQSALGARFYERRGERRCHHLPLECSADRNCRFDDPCVRVRSRSCRAPSLPDQAGWLVAATDFPTSPRAVKAIQPSAGIGTEPVAPDVARSDYAPALSTVFSSAG